MVRDRPVMTLYEPFAGSAALTIAASSRSVARSYVIGDSLAPLVSIWDQILGDPIGLARRYESVWEGQLSEGGREHFNRVRTEFNDEPEAARLLYLLARCVKNAPRFSRSGFSQSADHRRKGMHPRKMVGELLGAHNLLKGRTTTFVGDAEDCVREAGPMDLVYMDPPWQGTTEGVDKRYHQGFGRVRLETLLAALNAREIPWMLSYDGRSGERTYGTPLSSALWGTRLDLHAGRSSQATLVGRVEETVESLYISASLSNLDAPVSPLVQEELALVE